MVLYEPFLPLAQVLPPVLSLPSWPILLASSSCQNIYVNCLTLLEIPLLRQGLPLTKNHCWC